VGLIGKQVELRYHPEHPETVEIFYNQQSRGFVRPVDVHVNCRVKRDKNNNAELATEALPYQGGLLRFTGGSYEG
jgi:predicted nucleotidyltransferase